MPYLKYPQLVMVLISKTSKLVISISENIFVQLPTVSRFVKISEFKTVLQNLDFSKLFYSYCTEYCYVC